MVGGVECGSLGSCPADDGDACTTGHGKSLSCSSWFICLSCISFSVFASSPAWTPYAALEHKPALALLVRRCGTAALQHGRDCLAGASCPKRPTKVDKWCEAKQRVCVDYYGDVGCAMDCSWHSYLEPGRQAAFLRRLSNLVHLHQTLLHPRYIALTVPH